MNRLPPYTVLMPLAPWEPPDQVVAALHSLAEQTLPAAQVVLSCDGPPPAALEAAIASVALPLMIVKGPGGEGVGPVLTRGLQHCLHDLVVRADADDLSLADRCAVQVAAMVNRTELAALSAPLLEFIHSPDSPCSRRDVPIGLEALRRRSRWRNPINHPAVIMRRKTILAMGGYRDRPGFEDYDLWLRLLHRGQLLDNISTPLVLARVGIDHLARRRGFAYVNKEVKFFLGCAREGLLSWRQALLLIILRIPVRVLPSGYQKFMTRQWLRSGPRDRP